ncbi:hypothetical protein EDC94DRAFT_589687 [Helicostylum pulchrum]|nr:hypothetical protein EDC94DRAFT_589687 [Helicostylum pulchrum]
MWFDDKQRLFFNMKPDEWKEAKSSLKSPYHNSDPTVKYPEIGDQQASLLAQKSTEVVEFNNHSALPFLCEVKSLQSIAGLKKSENQHQDFIKLCNIMKNELDRMCIVTNKVVYGLLVEGFKCRLFAMDLKYYKLYILHMLSQFYLPRDKYKLGIISSCFSRLERLNVCT